MAYIDGRLHYFDLVTLTPASEYLSLLDPFTFHKSTKFIQQSTQKLGTFVVKWQQCLDFEISKLVRVMWQYIIH